MKTALLMLGLIVALTSQAEARTSDAVRVSGAWSRPAAAGQVGVGYFTVINETKTPDRLVAVSSPRAGQARMFRSVIVGNIATMPPVKALDLPPGQPVRFAPGGYHLMFEPLKTAQKLGDTLPVTLTFAHAGRVVVQFVVASGPPS